MLFLSWQCQKEDVDTVVEIDPELQKYVDAFVIEAKLRGMSIHVDNLILEYSDELDDLECGKCNNASLTNKSQKIVRINGSSQCWDFDQELEALVFHELGHCLLGRLHISDTLPNGDPKSMMIENDLTVYAPCKYVFGTSDECNNTHKRGYYVDELFDPATPLPSWAQ